jgi:hypothetical protein
LTSNFIGRSNWVGEQTANLDIGAFYIFDKALSDTQIQNYTSNLLSTNPPPLTEYIDVSVDDSQKVTVPVISPLSSKTLVFGHLAKGINTENYANLDIENFYLYNRALDNSEISSITKFTNIPLTSFITKSQSPNLETGQFSISSSSLNISSSSSYLAFNSSSDTIESGWSSSSGLYNSTTGAYIGSVSTLVSGSNYSGEWLQVQFPASFSLQTYSVSARPGYETQESPKSFILAGSRTGTTWVLLDSRSNLTWDSNNRTRSFTITNPKPYSYYRFICLESGSTVGYTNGASWTLRELSNSNGWESVTWSSELGIFAAVSHNQSNRVMTSPDGVAWTTRTVDNTVWWSFIMWNPDLHMFVATSGSAGGGILTSTDGITWTRRIITSNSLGSCAWSKELGLFVITASSGTGNRILTSPDGITWTTRSTPVDNPWGSVTWSPQLSLFVAITNGGGSGNRIMTSPDGINWTSRSNPVDNNWNSVVWAAELGIFVAVAFTGSSNRVMTSSDGINWVTRTTNDNGWWSVTWSKEVGLFVAVAAFWGSGDRIMTSPDGINWTTRSSPVDNNWTSVTWSKELGIFLASSSNQLRNVIMTSRVYPGNMNVYLNKINFTRQGSFSLSNDGRSVTQRLPQSGSISYSNFYDKQYIPTDSLTLLLDPSNIDTWPSSIVANNITEFNNKSLGFGTKILFDESTWYTSMITSGTAIIQGGFSDPFVQSRIMDGSIGSSGYIYTNNVPHTRFSSFIVLADIYFQTPGNTFSSNVRFFFDDIATWVQGLGIQIYFNFWSGALNGVGVYILKNGTIVAQNTSFNPNNFLNNWYSMSIHYNYTTTGTWNVFFNNTDILTFSDSDVSSWAAGTGTFFAHYAVTLGNLASYIRRLKFIYNLENIVVPSQSNITDFTTSNNYTLSCWAWISSSQHDSRLGDTDLISKWGTASNFPYTLRYVINSKLLRAGVYDGTTYTTTGTGIITNTWNHISCTFDWSNRIVSIYLNGLVGGSNLLPAGMGNISNTMPVRFMERGNTCKTTGRLGPISIHNKALTHSEIYDMYMSSRSFYTWNSKYTMTFCYSMRLLIPDYTGPVVRVRRSTDNVTADFYTNSTQTYLTTGPSGTGTSYATWISGATGYVTIWYDQSGNQQNATNTSNNLTQPNIALVNSKYVLEFRNADITRLNVSNCQPYTIFCHFYNTNSLSCSIITTQYDYQQRFWAGIHYIIGNSGDWYFSGTGTKYAYNNGSENIRTVLNGWNVFACSIETPVWTTLQTSPGTGYFNRIGADGHSSDRYLNGYMSEIICHNTALTRDDVQDYYPKRFF